MDFSLTPTAPSARHCPFASFGLGSPELTFCPGYLAAEIDFDGVRLPGDYPGKPRVRGTTCGHLGVAASPRGFRAACEHPDGPPTDWPGWVGAAIAAFAGRERAAALAARG